MVAREKAALELQRKGDLARALVEWKILGLLEPDNPSHAEREEQTRREARARAAEHLDRGDRSRAQGALDAALEEYLQALALEPLNPGPARRLRELEKERVRSEEAAKVSKLARRGGGAATTAPAVRPGPPAAPNAEAVFYLETGLEFLRQGEYEAAAVEIEKYLRVSPDDRKARGYLAEAHQKLGEASLKEGDAAAAVRHFEESKRWGGQGNSRVAKPLAAAREKLAEELYQKGMRASRADLPKAIEYWKQCLAQNPGHVAARSQLDKALRIQESLKGIR